MLLVTIQRSWSGRSQAQEYSWLSEAKKIIYCFLPKPGSAATCSELTIKLLNKTRTLMLTVKQASLSLTRAALTPAPAAQEFDVAL